MKDENQNPPFEDDEPVAEDNTENLKDFDDDDQSAEAVLWREGAKEDRAEYVHPDGARDFRVEGNDVRDYVGVDPEYMTYANPTEAPMLTDTERYDQTTQYDHLEGNVNEDDVNEDDQFGDESEETREEKVARYDDLVASGMSSHEASDKVWPGTPGPALNRSEPVKDSEPGQAGNTSETESKKNEFTPFS